MSADDMLDRFVEDHAEDHPYCTSCPLLAAVTALRAVLAVADEWVSQVEGYDTYRQIEDGKAIRAVIENALGGAA